MSKKSSIEVAIRVRPMRAELSESKCVWDIQNTKLTEKANPDCNFTFERVYNSNATTKDMYEHSVKHSIIKNVASGYNGTVFAYGQTGSGKSFTMLGGGEGNEGVVSMAIRDLFAALDEEKAKARTAGDGMVIQVFVSMLEIYNEQLRDLLVAPGQVAAPLSIRENEYGVYVHNATKRTVDNPKQALFIIHNEAESRRTSAATAMNERSSRSHCLIRIHVEKTLSFDVDSDDSESDGENALAGAQSGAGLKKKIMSSLNLVDLAGSERVAKTGAVGQRMVEGGHINKSLTSLTLVIKTLTDPPKPGASSSTPVFVNYRDSKLTHLLKTAIGGNSFTTVFCCMTMAEQHVDESRSTLQFAARAKTIKNEVSMNEVADSKTKIKELENNISRLKRTMVAMDIYLMAKKLKIQLLLQGGPGSPAGHSGGGAGGSSSVKGSRGPFDVANAAGDNNNGGGAAAEQNAQLQLIVEQLTLQNEELQRELQEIRFHGGGGGGHVDPHALGIADDPETASLRARIAEMEQELGDALAERDDLQESLNELDEMCKELEEENGTRTGEITELQHRNRTLENQVNSLKGLEQSLTKQLEQSRQQLHDADQRNFERARGDELLEQLTKLHIEHQSLQFEHNTLMDLYAREEVDKAATADTLSDRIKELQQEKDEMRSQMQLQTSYLWRLLSVSALATNGKAIDPEETKSNVREHQVEAAVKSLTAFVSSRMNRPPGVVDGDDDEPGTPKSWLKASRTTTITSTKPITADEPHVAAQQQQPALGSTPPAPTTLVGDEQLQKRIRELEQQIVAKDAQRDIIIDTKLKRIQELVLRLHTTNSKLTQELHNVGHQNNELFDIIKKEPKLLHKLNKTNLTPFNEGDALAKASFAPVPQKPFGHN